MRRFIAVLLGGVTGLGMGGHQAAPQVAVWQADLQIQSLVVSEEKGNLTARVVVAAEFGEAIGARVEVMLPVGVGIVSLGPGCVAGPNVTGINALRARVECHLGNMPARTNRELWVVTTSPPVGMVRGFAVVAMSETPDPKPGNNFVERVIPIDNHYERMP